MDSPLDELHEQVLHEVEVRVVQDARGEDHEGKSFPDENARLLEVEQLILAGDQFIDSLVSRELFV